MGRGNPQGWDTDLLAALETPLALLAVGFSPGLPAAPTCQPACSGEGWGFGDSQPWLEPWLSISLTLSYSTCMGQLCASAQTAVYTLGP